MSAAGPPQGTRPPRGGAARSDAGGEHTARAQAAAHGLDGRDAYRAFLTIPTRWMDNDSYAHVNNVVYYSYFDTAVNEHLIRAGGLDIARDPLIGLVVETSCRFARPLSFPDVIDAGLRVTRLGTSSVAYAIGLFRAGEASAAAQGRFVHVWVDRATWRPARVPDKIRAALAPLVTDPA